MLDQIIHWLQVTGTFIELLLLVRMLLLRLHRVYLFLTLYAVVNLLIDVGVIAAGIDSDPSARIFFNSRFLFAVLYPLAAWDVFEEVKSKVAKIRTMHLPRLLSGMFITLLLGFATSIIIEDKDFKGTSSAMDFAGLFFWLGAASSSLLFTWKVYRGGRDSEIIYPNNTKVWTAFFLLTFGRAILDCGFVIAGDALPHDALEIINVVLTVFDMGLALWCLVRLKPLPPDVTSATEKASL